MEELRATYDYILLDNPPYGVVVDALLCARVADRTIYVVRSGLFDKRALPDLQELYESGKMPNMSVLLYGYGYGYGYGSNVNPKPLYKRILGL